MVLKEDCKAQNRLEKGKKKVLGGWNLGEHGKVMLREN